MISIQYKATHPLWGVEQVRQGSVLVAVEKEPTGVMVTNMVEDFARRSGITPAQLAVLRMYDMLEFIWDRGKGYDSSLTIQLNEDTPIPAGEFHGLTTPELLSGARVQNVLGSLAEIARQRERR